MTGNVCTFFGFAIVVPIFYLKFQSTDSGPWRPILKGSKPRPGAGCGDPDCSLRSPDNGVGLFSEQSGSRSRLLLRTRSASAGPPA